MASNFRDKRKAAKNKAEGRKENTRTEKQVAGSLPKVQFSFKDLDRQQIPPGQKPEEWEKKGYLSYLFGKLRDISQLTMVDAKQQGHITEYKKFPPISDFKHPPHVAPDVSWAVIKNIKGQKGRVAGHIIDNVFYIVFLDLEHKFWKTKK